MEHSENITPSLNNVTKMANYDLAVRMLNAAHVEEFRAILMREHEVEPFWFVTLSTTMFRRSSFYARESSKISQKGIELLQNFQRSKVSKIPIVSFFARKKVISKVEKLLEESKRLGVIADGMFKIGIEQKEIYEEITGTKI